MKAVEKLKWLQHKDNKDSKSILVMIQNALWLNQILLLVLAFLFLLMACYCLWDLKQIQRENVEIKEAVYQLEKDNLNEQNSVYKMCISTKQEVRDAYSKLSDEYDMAVQDDIKELRRLMPKEEESLNEIQKILQSALQARRKAIVNGSMGGNGEQALKNLEEEYAPRMQEIDDLCKKFSDKVSESSRKQIVRMKRIILAMATLMILLATALTVFSTGKRKKIKQLINVPIKEMMTAMEELEKGNLQYESSYQSDNEMGILAECVRNTVRILRGYIGNIEQVLEALSEKNYNITNPYEYQGDFVRISNALDSIVEELNETIGDISNGISIVENAGTQVKDSAVTLAKETMENAATIEELTVSMEEIVGQVEQNLDKLEQVNVQEKEITKWVENCHEDMQRLERIMEDVVKNTECLENFMTDMDAITKEINMLSLNASIEAARAGSYGKGFAVVAEQVRHLSDQTVIVTGKSQQYIKDCTDSVDKGRNKVQQMESEMNRIVKQINEIKDMVQETSEVSNAQLQAMENFESAIEDMAKIVQNDSNLANGLERQAEDMELSVDMIFSKVQEFKMRPKLSCNLQQ